MSDSHVNDIRYTALWRPLIKRRANHLLPASFFRLLWQSLYVGIYMELVENLSMYGTWSRQDEISGTIPTGTRRNVDRIFEKWTKFCGVLYCELVTNEIEFSGISSRNILFLDDIWHLKIDFISIMKYNHIEDFYYFSRTK